jgi:hypothetical protein
MTQMPLASSGEICCELVAAAASVGRQACRQFKYQYQLVDEEDIFSDSCEISLKVGSRVQVTGLVAAPCNSRTRPQQRRASLLLAISVASSSQHQCP